MAIGVPIAVVVVLVVVTAVVIALFLGANLGNISCLLKMTRDLNQPLLRPWSQQRAVRDRFESVTRISHKICSHVRSGQAPGVAKRGEIHNT